MDFAGNESLIPLNPANEEKIILGHNVGYDRAKTADEYFSFKNSKSFYIDTIALYHARYARTFKVRDNELGRAQEPLFDGNLSDKLYSKYTSYNFQLSSLYKTQFKKDLIKDVRKIFDSTSKDLVVENFNECMHYCAKDVEATHDLFTVFWAKFLKKFTHPLEFIAMKELGNHKVTLNKENWTSFVKNCENDLKTTKLRLIKN